MTASAEGTGAVGEPIVLHLVWRVAPNMRIDGDASLELPDLVRTAGPTRWTLESRRDGTNEMTELAADVTLIPERAAYWRVFARADGFERMILIARSGEGEGALATYDEYTVIPERAATVDATLGRLNATHAEIVVTGAKGAGWRADERLALAPAGHGHVSTVAGDAGEHREWLEVPEGHALAIQVTAYTEVTFEGAQYAQAQGEPVFRKEAAMLCSTLSRSDGNVTLVNDECHWPDEWRRGVPAAPALLAVAAALLLARRR